MIQISRHRSVILVLLFLTASAATFSANADELHLQSIRSRLRFISTYDILYRREPHASRGEKEVAAAFRVVMELESSKLQVANLVKLTSHAEPDIRALALLGLVAHESRDVIPCCLRLMNDNALTLPLQLQMSSQSLPLVEGTTQPAAEVETQPQRVGHIARQILSMVGCPCPAVGSFGPRDDDLRKANAKKIGDWWTERKGTTDWLAWYGFLYCRASQGTSPVPDAAAERIARFRKQIDGLPATTRAWLLLFLADGIYSTDGEWHDYFASMEEMLDAVKGLGAENLLSFLRNGQRRGLRPPSLDDSGQGQRFITTNALHLFQKEHAPSLLELKHFTAAADADPTIVRRTVELGLRHFTADHQSWDRGRLVAALAVHGDASDREAATKWFYRESNTDSGSSAQSIFIGAIKRRRAENWREIIGPIVAHKHFERLKPLDVMYLALLVQKLGDVSLLNRASGTIYEKDSTQLRNEIRKLFKIAVVEAKTLGNPKTVLPEAAWSQSLAKVAHSMAISNDGKWLAVGMDKSNPAVHIVNAQNGQLLHRFDEPSGRYFRVEFVNAQKLVFAPRSNNLTGNLLTWTVGDKEHGAVAINREPDRLTNTRPQIIPSRQDGRFALLDTQTLGWYENSGTAWRYEKRGTAFSAFEVSPDALWIAHNDGSRREIELIATQDGQVCHVLEGLSTVPSGICFSPNSRRVMALGGDNRLIIWDTETGREVTTYHSTHSRFGPLCFTTDGNSFFVNAGQQDVGCFLAADGSAKFAIPFRVKGTQGNANGRIQSVVPSPDGRHLFVLPLVSDGNWHGPARHSRLQKWHAPQAGAERQ